MQFLFLLIPLVSKISAFSQDLFADYDANEEIPVDVASLGPSSFGDDDNGLQEASIVDDGLFSTSNSNLWDLIDDTPISFETSGDEMINMDLPAGDCPLKKRLKTRNEEKLCPNPAIKNTERPPRLPSLEDDVNTPGFLPRPQPDEVCSPLRPYHLCCDCDDWSGFLSCYNCKPCKPSLHRTFVAAEPQPPFE